MDPLNLGIATIPLEDIGYLAIFLIMTMDGANVPFTPSELFVGFTGYLAQTGEVNVVAAYLIGTLGSLTGNLVSFALGWKFGRPLLDRYGKFVFLSARRITIAERRIKRLRGAAPLAARFVPGLRNISSVMFGVFRFPQGTFVLLTAFGIVVYNAIFFLLGYVLGKEFGMLKDVIVPVVIIILAFGLALAATSWYRTRKETLKQPLKPRRS